MATDKRARILSPAQRIFGEDFNLSVFLSILRKNFIWLIVLLVAALTVVFLYLRYTYPVYRVSTQLIYRQNDASQALDFLGRPVGGSAFNNLQILKSGIILKPVIDQLPLSIGYFEQGRSDLLNTEYYRSTPFKVTAQVKRSELYNTPVFFQYQSKSTYKIWYELEKTYTYENLSFGKLVSTPHIELIAQPGDAIAEGQTKPYKERTFFFQVYTEKHLISWIANRLTATPYTQGGQLLQIDMEDHLPNRAADILSTINQVYIKYDVKRQQQGAENVLAFIDSQLDTITRELGVYEKKLKAFKLDKKITDPQSVTNQILNNLTELEQQKVQLIKEQKALNWLEDYVKSDQPLKAISPEIIDLEYKGYVPFLEQIESLQEELENLRLSLREDHLKIRYTKEQLQEVKANLFKNLDNMRKRLQVQEEYLNDQLGEANSDFAGLSALESEYLTLSRVRNNIEKYYLSLLDKQTEYQIRKASIVENFAVLEPPGKGTLVAPKRQLLQYGALGVGFLLWIGLVVMRYLLLDRIQTLQEIEEHADVPVLGTIPTHKHEGLSDELMVYAHPRSVITEAFRSLRSNLEFISPAQGSKLMAVTSTVSGEGKTYIAVNLAGVLHMAGNRVLLIDLDMRKPRQHKIFGLDNLAGMSTILIGKHPWEEGIHQVEEGFDFIPSGPLPPNPAELILSAAMKETIQQMLDRYDYVICDTPPVGMVSDALELIKSADLPIYVLRNDYSKREFINYPNRLVHETGVKHLSLVLNDVKLKRAGYSRYSYTYGYGNAYGGGYYSDEGTRSKTWWKRLFRR